MDRHPAITDVIIHDRIGDLFATASSSRARRGAPVSPWRKLAGAALVRLGVAILGTSPPTPATVPLGAVGLSR